MDKVADDRSEALGELNTALLEYVQGVEVLEQSEKVIADLKNNLTSVKGRISSNLSGVLSEGFRPGTIYFALGDGILKLNYDSLEIEIIKNSLFVNLADLKRANDRKVVINHLAGVIDSVVGLSDKRFIDE